MTLPMPEALLSRLLGCPEGMPAPDASERAACHAARRELEARGHRIVATREGAWILECAAEHFDPARFEALRAGTFGVPLEVWERRDSTNPRAWEAVASGAAPGWVVLAEEQEAGRGRQGRTWSCPAHGGLLFSLVAPANLGRSSRPQLLPLALALAVCESLRALTGRDIRLKWPNDLVVHERKLAGLLVEARAGVSARVVVGCGINVRVPADYFVAHGGMPVASLHDEGRALPGREEILAQALHAMERRLEQWSASRDEEILERWMELDVVVGRDVEAHLPGGVEQGKALGITASGLLRLRLRSGETRMLSAGEVHLR